MSKGPGNTLTPSSARQDMGVRLVRSDNAWEHTGQGEGTLQAPRRSESPDSRSCTRKSLRNQPAAPIPVYF